MHKLSETNKLVSAETEDYDAGGDTSRVSWINDYEVYIYIAPYKRLDTLTFEKPVHESYKFALQRLIVDYKQTIYGLGDWSFLHSEAINKNKSIKDIVKHNIIFVLPISINGIYVI